MKNQRMTKRSIVLCVLAMVLCVSLLVGATFAWFSDSLSSEVNKIISGNLDIGLNYWNAEKGEYADASDVELFDKNALWEPGYTQIVYLEVENRGNLSFNYLFTVYPMHETEGYLKNGNAFYLSEYLMFGFAPYDVEANGEIASREEALSLILNAQTKLTERKFQYGSIDPDSESVKLALVVYMPEHVTSDQANFDPANGKPEPKVTLAVDLYATQNTHEIDSFDDQYDSGLTPVWGDPMWRDMPNGLGVDEISKTLTVSSVAALKYLGTLYDKMAQNPNYDPAGWEIVLGSDIDFGGETLTEPLRFGGFKRFNGNHKVITNVIINYILVDEEIVSVGLFDELPDTQDLTLKNVTVNSQTTAAGALAGKLSGGRYNNVVVTDSRVSGIGYVGGLAGHLTFVNPLDLSGCCLFNTSLFDDWNAAPVYAGGLIGYGSGNAKVTVSNATISGLNATGVSTPGSYVGGIFGALDAEAVVEDSTVTEITIYKDVYIGSITGKIYAQRIVKVNDSTLAIQATDESGNKLVLPLVSEGTVEESNIAYDSLQLPPSSLRTTYNGHIYEVIVQNANWFVARDNCRNAYGHLASITSAEENSAVTAIARNYGNVAWLGATRNPAKNNVFEWETGEAVTYTNWEPGEPNNWDGIEQTIMIRPYGQWNDGNYNVALAAYVCEWDSLQSYLNYLADQTN